MFPVLETGGGLEGEVGARVWGKRGAGRGVHSMHERVWQRGREGIGCTTASLSTSHVVPKGGADYVPTFSRNEQSSNGAHALRCLRVRLH